MKNIISPIMQKAWVWSRASLIAGLLLTITGPLVYAQVTVLEEPAIETLGEQRVAVILVNFEDNPIEPYSYEEVQDLVFNQLDAYYREASYDKMWFSGEIFGWYTVPNVGCPSAENAQAIAGADPDIYYPDFDRLIFIYPDISECSILGGSSIGKLNISTDDGLLRLSALSIFKTLGFTAKILRHEMGHSLGLGHAQALECETEILSEMCVSINAADLFDVMGAVRTNGHLNASFKEKLGWLDEMNMTELSVEADSGIYTIEPFEIIATGPQVLKILGQRRTYYLEYRQPIGFDADFVSNIFTSSILPYNGALIHTNLQGIRSHLLDMTPNSQINTDRDRNDGTLDDGEIFVDETGLIVETIGHDAFGLALSISIPPLPSEPYLINFQPSNADLPAGYSMDDGSWFMIGRDFGWNTSLGLPTVERNVHPDQRLDTFVILNNATFTVRAWDFTLPNRDYLISLSSGDPGSAQGPHKIQVEDEVVVDNIATAANEFINIVDYPITVNDRSLTIQLGGGTGSTTLINYLKIQPVNHVPVLNPIGTKMVDEGQALSFVISATDADGDPLTYSASNLPAGAAFDPSTQVFTWTPDFTQAGNYFDVDFSVTDGQLSDSEAITIMVNNINRPPSINTGPTASPGNISEAENSTVSVSASDPDGDALIYGWSASGGTLSGIGGTVTYTPPAVSVDTVFTLTVSVDDGKGGIASGSVDITLSDVPPATPEMHVSQISMSLTTNKGKVRANGQITIRDANGSPVSSATVQGHWSGVTIDTDTVTTSASGLATANSNFVKKKVHGTFTFTVDNVSKDGFDYDPAANTVSSGSISR